VDSTEHLTDTYTLCIYSKTCWVVLTQSNMDKPSRWVTFLKGIFNPMSGFVHI